jgi:hypothetical protein
MIHIMRRIDIKGSDNETGRDCADRMLDATKLELALLRTRRVARVCTNWCAKSVREEKMSVYGGPVLADTDTLMPLHEITHFIWYSSPALQRG